MKICLFEDTKISNLYPMIYFRPACDLRVGSFTIRDKILKVLKPEEMIVLTRDYLRDYFQFSLPEEEENYWFLNATLLPYQSTLDQLNLQNEPVIEKGRLVSYKGSYREFKKLLNHPLGKTMGEQTFLFEWIWNLFDHNESLLKEDFSLVAGNLARSEQFPGVWISNPEKVKLGEHVKLEPGVVINAEEGPVVLGNQVTVQANSLIKGPVFIGDNSLVKSGAKLYGHLSCGPVCKLNGEVEESIILGYSNKQHDGFLGHAYLGEWINLGAGTTNSDLKNNYSPITVTLNHQSIQTGRRFLGLIMGDHSKSAINTSFNTGTIVGVNSNIFMRQFPPKFIPSFSWVGDSGMQDYQMEKALQVAEIVMRRRNQSFENSERTLFEIVKKLSMKIEGKN